MFLTRHCRLLPSRSQKPGEALNPHMRGGQIQATSHTQAHFNLVKRLRLRTRNVKFRTNTNQAIEIPTHENRIMTRAAKSHLLSLYLLISSITCTTALSAPRIQATNEVIWERALAKGTVLYQQLESGCYPDTVNPIDLEGLKAIGFHIGSDEKSYWPPKFQEKSAFSPGESHRFKWTTAQQAYWKTSVDRFYWVPWKDITRFNNEYSPRNGLITALSARRAAAETLHWSDITFAIWQAVTTFSGRNINDLRFIAHHAIQHPSTQLIINRLID
ncbi:MAG: hypothetical protein Q9198_011063, partial [Flavoplaca austrocitrina]